MTIQELGQYCEDNNICQQYKKAVQEKFNNEEFYDIKLNTSIEERIAAVLDDFCQNQKNLSRKEVRHLLFEAEWELSECIIYKSGWIHSDRSSKNPKTILKELEALGSIEIQYECVSPTMITVVYKEKRKENNYHTMIITTKQKHNKELIHPQVPTRVVLKRIFTS